MRFCLLLMISVLTLQESASESTSHHWSAPTSNLIGESTYRNVLGSREGGGKKHWRAPTSNLTVTKHTDQSLQAFISPSTMQKGILLLFLASLGIAWVHASTTSSSYSVTQLSQTEDLLKKIEDIQKEVDSIDGRLNKTEKRTAVCGFRDELTFSKETTLTFERVYDEVNSGGVLEDSGYFTAQITGVYLVTLETAVRLHNGEYLFGYLKLSSGQYNTNNEGLFISSDNDAKNSDIADQASASRYVKMATGETLHISLFPGNGTLSVHQSILCVSLYSASD